MSVAAGAPSPRAAPGAQRMTVAITSGEPAGVGPELCLRIVERDWPVRLVVLGDIELMRARAAAQGSSVQIVPFDAAVAPVPGVVEVVHLPLAHPSLPGKLDPANGAYVLRLLDQAIEGCVSGRFAAMVTAPVHKGVICEGLGAHDTMPFTGHTEYLAEHTGTPRVVMMLVGGGLRVALVTTHLPLAAVPAAITPQALEETLRIVHADLVHHFGLKSPRILVAGLNPHAGEGGHMGREEIDVIIPVLERLRAQGCSSSVRCRPIPWSCRTRSRTATRCWPCTTTRVCRCSSTPASAAASMSRSGCRSSALRSTTVPRSTSPALAAPTRAACLPRSSSRSTWPPPAPPHALRPEPAHKGFPCTT